MPESTEVLQVWAGYPGINENRITARARLAIPILAGSVEGLVHGSPALPTEDHDEDHERDC